MSDHTEPSPADRARRLTNVPHDAIALRVYEICVTRGYVDKRDWIETARQVRREASRKRSAGPAGAGPSAA